MSKLRLKMIIDILDIKLVFFSSYKFESMPIKNLKFLILYLVDT